MCIDHIDIISTPVNQLTIEQTHKEYNFLVDKIVAKYQQLSAISLWQLIPLASMPNLLNWQVSLLI